MIPLKSIYTSATFQHSGDRPSPPGRVCTWPAAAAASTAAAFSQPGLVSAHPFRFLVIPSVTSSLTAASPRPRPPPLSHLTAACTQFSGILPFRIASYAHTSHTMAGDRSVSGASRPGSSKPDTPLSQSGHASLVLRKQLLGGFFRSRLLCPTHGAINRC